MEELNWHNDFTPVIVYDSLGPVKMMLLIKPTLHC